MGKFDKAQDRVMDLLGDLGDGIRSKLPGKGGSWLETAAALGAMKAGSRVAGTFVRRNPVLVGSAVVGAGLLYLASRRRAQKRAVLEGRATRVSALGRDDALAQEDYGT